MRRSKFELHLDILKALSHGAPMKQTQIMYKVNICYQFLERYLDFLIKQGLVEIRAIDGQRTTYVITQKGLSALSKYQDLKMFLPIIEENRNSHNASTLLRQCERSAEEDSPK